MNLINDLKKIGLNEKEARVYLALLTLGGGSVQEIAAHADVKRSTVYVILEELAKMGLCGTIGEQNKTVYSASDPEAIKSLIQMQKKELDERLDYFDKIKENLDRINNKSQKNKPMVSFYEGKQALLNSSAELYSETEVKKIRSVYPLDRLVMMLNDAKFAVSREKNRARRKKLGITASVICNSNKLDEYSDDLDTYAVIDAAKYPIEADINLVGDMVRITTWDEKSSAVIIRKREIARTLATLFDLAWLGAQTLKKKK